MSTIFTTLLSFIISIHTATTMVSLSQIAVANRCRVAKFHCKQKSDSDTIASTVSNVIQDSCFVACFLFSILLITYYYFQKCFAPLDLSFYRFKLRIKQMQKKIFLMLSKMLVNNVALNYYFFWFSSKFFPDICVYNVLRISLIFRKFYSCLKPNTNYYLKKIKFKAKHILFLLILAGNQAISCPIQWPYFC